MDRESALSDSPDVDARAGGNVASLRRRVYLYITQGRHLLVLRHVDFPDLGLQIPGGTVEAGEHPETAATREAREETGIRRLSTPRMLDRAVLASERFDEDFLDAWFFHLVAAGQCPESWRHEERCADGKTGPIQFELSWLPVDEAAERLGASDRRMLASVW